MADALDCRRCGACCLGQLVVVGKAAVPHMMRTADGLLVRTQGGRCVALEGRAGVDVRCTIYSKRPEVCRVFRAGSEPCLELRAAEGVFHG